MGRAAKTSRKTSETDIVLSLDLDGSGRAQAATGIGFLDHMLTALARHAMLDLEVAAQGDLHIDFHHTTEDVGIANAPESKSGTGLIYGRQAYYDGIVGAYRGSSGKEKNLLVMKYEGWEYIPMPDGLHFYTIGEYTLQPDTVGVNCWLLRRDSPAAPWRIFRVINN